MKKTVWTFGLISGAILSLMMMLTIPFSMSDSISSDTGMLIGYTTMVLAFLLVYFGVRSYRDNVAGGTVGFGRALAVGSLIALVSSACYVATWEVIYFKVAPEYSEKIATYSVDRARARGASPEEIAKAAAEAEEFMKMYQNPAFNAAITFLEPLPVALVFALVSAGVLSRRRRRRENGLVAAVA